MPLSALIRRFRLLGLGRDIHHIIIAYSLLPGLIIPQAGPEAANALGHVPHDRGYPAAPTKEKQRDDSDEYKLQGSNGAHIKSPILIERKIGRQRPGHNARRQTGAVSVFVSSVHEIRDEIRRLRIQIHRLRFFLMVHGTAIGKQAVGNNIRQQALGFEFGTSGQNLQTF